MEKINLFYNSKGYILYEWLKVIDFIEISHKKLISRISQIFF